MSQIDLENLSLRFWVTQRGTMSSRQRLSYLFTGRKPQGVREVTALDGINLNLREGDRLGIVGHNGAGKSTLLKVIADIYAPSGGRRHVQGGISALFDFSLGFEVDATGWENIAYRHYLLGENKQAVRAKKGDIAVFSELGEALDIPVRYYSSGMKIRLAFAIATAIRPDILLVDEAFTASDLPFRTKAKRRLRELMAQASIVIMVSHELDLLADMCEKVLWLDHARVLALGPTKELLARYVSSCQTQLQRVA
jgi:ABC-type polysaccharide/polyol phosphate transport system ATPase subunit